MINKLAQVMLYVNNQGEAVKFWTEKVGFQIVAEENNGPMRWIEVAPSKEKETSIILHNKEKIAKMSPGLNLGTPSLMFTTTDLEKLYSDLSGKGVKVGEIVKYGTNESIQFCRWGRKLFCSDGERGIKNKGKCPAADVSLDLSSCNYFARALFSITGFLAFLHCQYVPIRISLSTGPTFQWLKYQ